MFVLVVGGGKVGYYLTKELVENGHEVVLMEKDRARAAQIVEGLFRHLGVDEIISPTRMALGSIEQDIPVHELLHLAQLNKELGIIEAHLQADSPAVGKTPTDLVI